MAEYEAHVRQSAMQAQTFEKRDEGMYESAAYDTGKKYTVVKKGVAAAAHNESGFSGYQAVQNVGRMKSTNEAIERRSLSPPRYSQAATGGFQNQHTVYNSPPAPTILYGNSQTNQQYTAGFGGQTQ